MILTEFIQWYVANWNTTTIGGVEARINMLSKEDKEVLRHMVNRLQSHI